MAIFHKNLVVHIKRQSVKNKPVDLRVEGDEAWVGADHPLQGPPCQGVEAWRERNVDQKDRDHL